MVPPTFVLNKPVHWGFEVDLIKHAQSACQFPEFQEEERRLVDMIGRYIMLLPEPSRRNWLAVAALWVLMAFGAFVFASVPLAAGSDPKAYAALPLLLLLILLGALYNLLTVRLSALQTPEIFEIQRQITEHGAQIALMFRAYRRGIVAISHVLFIHLKTCTRIRADQLDTAQEAIETLFSEIRPDANEARRNRKTKTKVPRESDYTLEDFVGGSDSAVAAFEKVVEQYKNAPEITAAQGNDTGATDNLPLRMMAIERAADMECRTELRFLKVIVTENQDRLIADLRANAEDLRAGELAAEAERLTQSYILDPVQNLLENLQAAQDILLDTVYARGDDAPEMWTVNISAVSRRLIAARRIRRRNYRLARALGGWLPIGVVTAAAAYLIVTQAL